MPLMPSDIPPILEGALKTVFLQELESLKPSYQRVAQIVPTTQETQDYGWVGSPPAIRELIDERVGKGLAISGMKITDKTWEATIAVSRRELENNQYGIIRDRVRGLAQRMAQGIDSRIWTMLCECYTAAGKTAWGTSFDGYDKNGAARSGNNYFAIATHTYPEPAEYTSNQSNFPDTGLSEAQLFIEYNAMCAWKDDRGEILPYVPDLLIAAPTIYQTALQITRPGGAVVPAAAAAYRMVGDQLGLDIMMCPYWAADVATGTRNWALACTRGITKPAILQVFTPTANGQLFEFSALEGNSDSGFMRDMYYYGIRGRWNIGYGDWRTWIYNAIA